MSKAASKNYFDDMRPVVTITGLMAMLEDIFREIKEKFSDAFRDDLPPGPPTFSNEVNTPIPVLGTFCRVGRKPDFKDPSRTREEYVLGKAADITERLKSEGLEALAWYMPYHFNEAKWGIYIHWSRLKQLSSHVSGITNISPRVCLAAIYDELISHELFHCRTEIFSTVGEELSRDPFYLPYSKQYKQYWGTDKCIEEALATSYGLANVKNRIVRQELELIADALPDGYKQWGNYPYSSSSIFRGDWWQGIAQLTYQITGDWTPGSWELSAHSITAKLLYGVPRYIWFEGKTIPADGLSYLVQHKDFLAALRKLFPEHRIDLINTHKGKHPHKLFINRKSIPYKVNWDGVPTLIFNQVAHTLGVKASELRQKVETQLAN